ncbi:hypothetical protein PR202_gn00388 [Eleusine coracana subsp. coracana]|uniref:DUF4057 domain-containing protein n=1 Tax=Eleusine coracana subsp. coracana TaxID=191504 RepID=A0AAV5G2A8_ELECO|nr:hypothetical protein QOZ80_3AG0250500 [Eleusine coracana subsp. coracana]GJN41063.1 hypothetical protein PR202_gn00388 [Eleusine coracana subsp. coracana]
MERTAPVRSSHTSTSDLLAWPQNQGPTTPSPARHPGQPSEAIKKVVFGGQVSEEEADSLSKRKQCSAPKWKEMTGSGIFAAGSNGESGEDGSSAAKPARAAPRNHQAISTVSHISFAEDGSEPPKKPTSVAEVAKQRELSGTLQSAADSKTKQISNAKSKELSGHDIFADPQDSRPNRARNSSNGSSASQTPVKNANVSTFSFGETNADSVPKTSKKITGKKFTDLTGNDIFKGDVAPASVEKHLSTLKLKEITGSNIFADGQEPPRERVSGNRKPPGGVSSITLV